MNIYYVYQYLRSKDSDQGKAGTPYYVGKGCRQRAWDKKRSVRLPSDKSLIVLVAEHLTESEAFDLEKSLIKKWGRLDIGTGILRNKTDGGEGSSGLVRTKESNEKTSKSLTGHTLSQKTRDKIGKSNKGKTRGIKRKNPRSDEYREKQRQSQLGHSVSEEVRKRMSESAKLRWQRRKAEADSFCLDKHSVSEGLSNSSD